MSTPPRSLSARVSWARLLNQLEVAVPSLVMAAIVLRCPLCEKSRLTIMQDYLVGGQWFHCPDCNESGDMIELAAKAWGLSIEGTIIKLIRRGLDLPTDADTVRAYRTEHLEYGKRLDQLWKDSQSHPCHSQTMLRPRLTALRLPDELSLERWNAGPVKILGENLCHTIEETLLPGSVTCCGNEQIARCRSARRIFRGSGWHNVLAFPFYTAPHRIVAFGFIGWQGDMNEDYVFRPANVSPFHRTHPEAGLAMHPQTQEIAGDWDKCIFAVSDPLLYLDLHLRQFSYSNNAIPLVLWQDNPAKSLAITRTAWQQFRNRKIIFWDPSFSVPMLQQAMAINGCIAMVGPRNCVIRSPRKYCRSRTPAEVCRKLQRNAKPWPDALAFAMLRWADSQIEDFFLQIQIDAPQLDRVRRACRPGLRDRFDAIMVSSNIGNTVPVDGGVVVAQDGGWYVHHDSYRRHQMKQICNGQVRLDRLITYPEPGHAVFDGVVKVAGEDVPFAAPARAFEANPFRWLSQYLASIHKPVLHYESKWSKRVINIAAQFHMPTTVPGVASVGWDARKLHFAIPGYRIGLDGVETVPDRDVPMPGVGLVLQDSITDTWGKYDDYGSALYWATLGCILDDIMAPALLRDTRGIGLLGLGAKAVGASIAQAAGCMSRTIRGPAQLRTALADEQKHHWPIHVELPLSKNGSKVRGWQTQSFPRNCITPVLAPQPGWWTITGEGPAKVRPRLLRLTKRIMAAYLRDVCERRLRIEDLHEDLAGFIARQGGSVPLDQVRSVLWAAT